MKKSSKIFLSVAFVALLAASCNKQVSVNTNTASPTPTPQVSVTPEPTAVTPRTGTQTRDNADKPDYTPGYVVVTQTVEGSNLNQPYNKVKESTTAYDLLNSTHKVTFKDYGSMGKFVESIDGVAPDSKHFWKFYVNGKSSNVGASDYAVKDGDKLEWKLDTIN